MKIRKILLSVCLCVLLLASMVVPAMASIGGLEVTEQEDIDITIKLGMQSPITVVPSEGDTNTNFVAYQIMSVKWVHFQKVDPPCTDGDKCTNREHFSYSYAINDEYRDIILQSLKDSEAVLLDAEVVEADEIKETMSDSAVISILEKVESNSNAAEFFTRMLNKHIVAALAGGTKFSDKTTWETNNCKFETTTKGYYLIRQVGLTNEQDTYSFIILDTNGPEEEYTVELKKGQPSLTKKILISQEDGTKTEVDAVDVNIGDTVEMQLTVVLPEDIDNYVDTTGLVDSYLLQIHDLAKGLNTPTTVTAQLVNGEGVKGTIPTTNVTLSTTDALHDTDGCTDCSFHIAITEKESGLDFASGDSIVVTYNTTLKDDCTLGAGGDGRGNSNTAYVEYPNDPNLLIANAASQTYSRSKQDTVSVFTYQVEVSKVDKDDLPLAGADFDLEVWNGTDWVATNADLKTEVTATTTGFLFTGVDSGKYRLKETKVPDGYNGIEEDIVFEITPVFEETSDLPTLTALTAENVTGPAEVSADVTIGQFATKVVNNSGTRLPSTGGIGTYALYIGGGLCVSLALIAFVVLNKKKSIENGTK